MPTTVSKVPSLAQRAITPIIDPGLCDELVHIEAQAAPPTGVTLAVLAGRCGLAAQEFLDSTQAGDLDLARSRCVVVRRLDVGALRQRRIDAMEFRGFEMPPGRVRPFCR